MTITKSSCPSCHEAVEPSWKLCPYCGASLALTAPARPPAQAIQPTATRRRASGPNARVYASALPEEPAPEQSDVVRLACPSCGAQLPIPKDGAENVTCSFCGSSLQLRRSAGGLSLEMAQQVGRSIGQEVGQQVRQEMTEQFQRQQAQLVRLEKKQRLDELGLVIRQFQGEIASWQATKQNRRRNQILFDLRVQLAQTEQEYADLYAELYPPAAGMAASVTQSRRSSRHSSVWLTILLWFFGFGFAISALGTFGVPLAILGAALALFSAGYRGWLELQPGYAWRLARLPGLSNPSPGGLAAATLAYLGVPSLVCAAGLISAMTNPSSSASTSPPSAGGMAVTALIGLVLLYGWCIRGWGLSPATAVPRRDTSYDQAES